MSTTDAPRSRDERLTLARDLLERAGTAGKAGAQLRRPRELVPGAGVLPVAPVLAELFPGGGLPRGAVVAVESSPALLLALLAQASADGSWCAVVGMPQLGLVAAHEAGLELSRVALIPRPGGELVGVVSALLDGLDLVALAAPEQLRAGDRQRLTARARQRGAVLLSVGSWPGAALHVHLDRSRAQWQGIGGTGQGHGRLRSRQAPVQVTGRAGPHATRTASVLLPGSAGAVAALEARTPVNRSPEIRRVG